MNNKRQTIWLVSMLSLMVILSAYYLFTEDAPSTKDASGAKTQLTDDAGKVLADEGDGIQITQVDSMADDLTGTETGSAPDGVADPKESAEGATAGDGEAPDDKQVIANAAGNEILEQAAYDQAVKISKLSEELSAKVGDTKSSQEDAMAAAEALDRLQDMDARITSLQEKLLQEFDNAVVTEEQDSFKVIVLSDKLEKKQALGILDMATKELEVGPGQVSVQYVQ